MTFVINSATGYSIPTHPRDGQRSYRDNPVCSPRPAFGDNPGTERSDNGILSRVVFSCARRWGSIRGHIRSTVQGLHEDRAVQVATINASRLVNGHRDRRAVVKVISDGRETPVFLSTDAVEAFGHQCISVARRNRKLERIEAEERGMQEERERRAARKAAREASKPQPQPKPRPEPEAQPQPEPQPQPQPDPVLDTPIAPAVPVINPAPAVFGEGSPRTRKAQRLLDAIRTRRAARR